jgi:hypothetical protein
MAGQICCLCYIGLAKDPQHLHGERLCPKCLSARYPKRKVRMHFYDTPAGLDVCFCENSEQIGRRRLYKDPDKLFEILKAAHAIQEDHHSVAEALKTRRMGSVGLTLSEEQYRKLRSG